MILLYQKIHFLTKYFFRLISAAFTTMLEYMRVRGENAKKIDTIEKTYENLISM